MTGHLSFHGLTMAEGCFCFEGASLPITGKEAQILERLMRCQPEAVSFQDLLDELYGEMDAPELKIITVFVCKLRRKLMDAAGGRIWIESDQPKQQIRLVFQDDDPPAFPGAMAMRA